MLRKIIFTNIISIVLMSSVLAESQKKDDFAEKIRAFGKNGEINEKKTAVAEILVLKNEKKAMEQVNKLIKKYKGSSLEPGLLFRKAELVVRQSKSARFFEFQKSNEGGDILTMVPPELKNANSIKKLKEAVAIYTEIEKRFPKYEQLDMVLFNSAFLRQQLGEKQTPKDIYYSLIKRFPGSELVPDTYLAVAEMNYDQKLWKKALEDYENIKNYPNARIYPYGLYKTAWTKYQLKDTDGAMEELQNVILESERRQALNETKYNLKEEALGDLVLFYSEKGIAKNAFEYFLKWAGKELAGKYVLQLANLYERHGQNVDREFVLSDFIYNLPQSAHVPKAYRDLILNDIFLKRDDQAFKHLNAFQDHCLKYYKTEMADRISSGKSQKEEDLQDEEDAEMDSKPNCHFNLAKMSYRLSKKWHDEWKKNKNKGLISKVETAYEIYISSQIEQEKREKVRFAFAEFNFQRGEYKSAMDQYETVSKNIKDASLLHDASYFAIISLEKQVSGKWSDKNEEKYLELATHYISKNPAGKYLTDIKFKKSFIAYEKKRYAEALPGFKDLGWKYPSQDVGLKSQDLYLDILNIQRDFVTLMSSTKQLIEMTKDDQRKSELTKLYRETFYALAQKYHQDKKYSEALVSYEKFALENKSSKFADQAWWNIVQIYLTTNQFKQAADKGMELVKLFPDSKLNVDALKKSAELYEYLARPELVGEALSSLSILDSSESDKWKRMSLDFYIIGGEFDKAKKIIASYLSSGDGEIIRDLLQKYETYGAQLGLVSQTVEKLAGKYQVAPILAKQLLEKQKDLFAKKDFSESFRLGSKILSMNRKEVPNSVFAEARYIQSQILEKELVSQSVKSKVDRLQMVLALKTEKLDKAQRSYQETMKYGDPETSIKAFLGLVRCYQNFVSDLKNFTFTEQIAAADEKLIRSELEKMIIPLEDKILDTLNEGMDLAKKARLHTGSIQLLRNEINKMNLKLNKLVSYKPMDPGVSIVQ